MSRISKRRQDQPWQRVGLGSSGRRPSSHSRRPFFRRKNLCSLTLFSAISLLFLWVVVLPYDSTLRLAVRWNLLQLRASSRPSESWVFSSRPAFEVDLARDVLVIIKTGYGTRHRVPAWLEALRDGNEFADLLVIADYEGQGRGEEGDFEFKWEEEVGKGKRTLQVHDMVKRSLEHKSLRGKERHGRVDKYKRLSEAIRGGDEERATKLSREFGWELDALKVIYV